MEKVEIGESVHGDGVMAKVPIEPWETIFFLNGTLVDFQATLMPGGEYCVQIGPDQYVNPLPPGRYLNHACEPNAGLRDQIRVVALRQIGPGTEVTIDYSTCMWERHWELDCQCGSPQCRGRIGDFDLLEPDLKERYLRLGVVQDFIVEQLVTAGSTNP